MLMSVCRCARGRCPEPVDRHDVESVVVGVRPRACGEHDACDEPGAEDVAELRNRLAKIWLSDHLGQSDPRRAAVWEKAAQRNAKLEPEDRIGFIMPYPEKRNRRFARFMPILPPEMF